MNDLPEFHDSAFDLRARAELSLAFDPGQPPEHLFRNTSLLSRRGFQRGLATFLFMAAAQARCLLYGRLSWCKVPSSMSITSARCAETSWKAANFSNS